MIFLRLRPVLFSGRRTNPIRHHAFFACSLFSSSSLPQSSTDFTVSSLDGDGIFTIRMNRPDRLNAWTEKMLLKLTSDFKGAAENDAVRAVVLTGTGSYYCAGVDLASILRPMHPAKLHEILRVKNQELFDMFINFPKPLIAAVNGPALGASVTAAAMCDAIVASSNATFSTPFHRLGLPPEGCSSVHFKMIMGAEKAEKMVGIDGWAPTAEEAANIGLVHTVVPKDGDLMEASWTLANDWIKKGKVRMIGPTENTSFEHFRRVNANESIDLADAFFSAKFLEGQQQFLSSRGKNGPAMMFSVLGTTRPIWRMFLPPEGQGKS